MAIVYYLCARLSKVTLLYFLYHFSYFQLLFIASMLKNPVIPESSRYVDK